MPDRADSTSRDVVTVIGGLVAEAWRVVEANLSGLTDAEYFWEPAPGCWNVRLRSELTTSDSWGRGEYAVETSFDDSHTPTTTTIAWRLLHAYDCFRDYASRAFGRGPLDWDDIEIPGSAAVATQMMRDAVDEVRHYCEGSDAVLFEHEGDRPHWLLLDRGLLEWIHHCAEIGVLRTMFRLDRGVPSSPDQEVVEPSERPSREVDLGGERPDAVTLERVLDVAGGDPA